jgi:hypothetical protein
MDGDFAVAALVFPKGNGRIQRGFPGWTANAVDTLPDDPLYWIPVAVGFARLTMGLVRPKRPGDRRDGPPWR